MVSPGEPASPLRRLGLNIAAPKVCPTEIVPATEARCSVVAGPDAAVPSQGEGSGGSSGWGLTCHPGCVGGKRRALLRPELARLQAPAAKGVRARPLAPAGAASPRSPSGRFYLA